MGSNPTQGKSGVTTLGKLFTPYGLSQLHSADDEAIAWLTNYGS